MKKEIIEKQFKKITRGIDEELVHKVSGSLVEDYKRGELGYLPRCNLVEINSQDNEKCQLRDKLQSWVEGFFGLRIDKKMDFIKEFTKFDHEGETENSKKEPRISIESDFIESTGINLGATNTRADQYKAVSGAIDFASMIGYYSTVDSMFPYIDGYLQYNLRQVSDDLLKQRINLHLEGKSEEYSTAFKATYGWLLKGFFDDEVGSKRERFHYLSSKVEEIHQRQNYNPIPLIKWSKIK